ncbi:unnamed protein product [Moritella viscosa]|nr:unnamed protein product [Moritella viscosa]
MKLKFLIRDIIIIFCNNPSVFKFLFLRFSYSANISTDLVYYITQHLV